jgi:hypothetical protein
MLIPLRVKCPFTSFLFISAMAVPKACSKVGMLTLFGVQAGENFLKGVPKDNP